MNVIDISAAPQCLQDLVGQLTDEGFSVATTLHYSKETQHVVLSRDEFRVRVVAERGKWFLEMQAPGMDRWFDTDIWEACIDGIENVYDVMGIEHKAAFVASRWQGVVEEYRPELLMCLRRINWGRIQRRLGLDSS